MRKIITKIIVLILFTAVFVACSDEYFDVNTPSNTAKLDQLRMQDLMAPVIHSTMEAQRSAELAFGNYVQNFVSSGGGAAGQTTASGLWNQVYLYILPNIKAIKEKAAENNAVHIGAIADVLTAINIGIATDTWDNIPYSDATNGPDNNFPTFDTQQDVYTQIFTLLDAAIAALEGSDASGFNLGSSDLIYGGDSDKWLRTAYSIKARYQLHLVNKGIVTANDVLTTIANGYTSSSDDFQMFYDEKSINPWYSTEVLARATGNLSNDIASQLVSSMNGDYYPFQGGSLTIDPSYAEAMFIKAEAAFLANGGTTTSTGSNAAAYTAYLEGIQASMDMYGVDGTDYLADGAIAVGEAGLMLNHIMKEKYIHNFLNPETFVDFRRYDFSDDAFTGLQIRLEDAADANEFTGQWFRRAEYPSTELSRNETNVIANQQTPVTPVWWDN